MGTRCILVKTTNAYDAANCLVGEVTESAPGLGLDDDLDQTIDYEYDLAGNRLSKSVDVDSDGSIDSVTTYVYDENDRLQTESLDADNDGTVDQTTTYSYDGTQRTGKTVTSAAETLSTVTYTYDLQGRLETADTTTFESGAADRIEHVRYDYDATGIRVSSRHQIDTEADGSVDSDIETKYLIDHRNFTGYQQVIRKAHFAAAT